MRDGADILLDLNREIPTVYPDESIHSIEIEKNLPIWNDGGEADFSTMLGREVRVVFVCFINRSGSNYLLDLVQQLDLGAYPTDEAFNYEEVIARCRKNDVGSFSAYLAKIILAAAQNGFRFLKVGGEQLYWLTKHDFISRMMSSQVPPKFIVISREDKVAQAVSLYIAEATGRYSEFRADGACAAAAKDVPIGYDAARILDRLRYVFYQEQLFSLFFTLHAVEFLPMKYEDLLRNPKAVLRDMLRYVEAPKSSIARLSSIAADGKTVIRQGGELNRILIDRFRTDFKIA
jgi:LPS sulfotransferase NodH